MYCYYRMNVSKLDLGFSMKDYIKRKTKRRNYIKRKRTNKRGVRFQK